MTEGLQPRFTSSLPTRNPTATPTTAEPTAQPSLQPSLQWNFDEVQDSVENLVLDYFEMNGNSTNATDDDESVFTGTDLDEFEEEVTFDEVSNDEEKSEGDTSVAVSLSMGVQDEPSNESNESPVGYPFLSALFGLPSLPTNTNKHPLRGRFPIARGGN